MADRRACKDCPPGSRRPAPHPGPRCATHHRERKRAVSTAAHAKRIVAVYGITAEQYEALYQAQGGRCAICRKATGKRRRLAVDHDHATGEVRGLACMPCNRDVLGKLGDDPAEFDRVAAYLRTPPARAVLSGTLST